MTSPAATPEPAVARAVTGGVTDGPRRLDLQIVLALDLFRLLSDPESTAARVRALVAPTLPMSVLVRIEPDSDDRAADRLVRLLADDREWPVPRSAVGTALAHAVGTPEVSLRPDVSAVVDRLEAAEGGPERAVGELLGQLCRAVLVPGGPNRAGAARGEAEPAPEAIDVSVEPDYLRTLTIGGLTSDPFTFARDGLFSELGVPFPPFQLHRDAALRSGAFSVGLPGVSMLPRVGLTVGTIMVNDTVERLALMDVTATATTNPGTNQPAAIVPAEHEDLLTATGLTTWDPLGYLILCVADAMRNAADRFVTPVSVGRLLAQLAPGWPFLFDAVRDRFELDEITSVLGALAREQVSIRNLLRILSLLLRAADEDVPPEKRLTYVRAGLADQTADKLSRGTSTVAVYLLDPELERGVAGPEGERYAQELRHGLDEVLVELAPTAQVPAILTTDEARLAVYLALAPSLPRIQVIGWSELPVTVNIQMVDRISPPDRSAG